jgi:hypothetical protein
MRLCQKSLLTPECGLLTPSRVASQPSLQHRRLINIATQRRNNKGARGETGRKRARTMVT